MNRYAEVPTVDVSPLSGNDPDEKLHVARQIDAACRRSGFFYARNHGIDLCELQDVTTAFLLSMTDSEKFDLAIHAYNPSNRRSRNGYYMAVKGKKANESYCYLNPSFTDLHSKIKAGVPLHEVNKWPDETTHPGLQSFYEEYYWKVYKLSLLLLRGFALALGKNERFFDPYFASADTLSAVSLIRYPHLLDYPPVKVAPDGTELSFEHHKDVSLITVLYQTPIQNLQLEAIEEYLDIPTSDDCYLVNCGTFMAHLTRDYYPAPVHRVKFVNAERLSIPFFVHLNYDSVIMPFDVSNSHHDRDDAHMSYGKYLETGLHELIVKNGQT